MKVRRLGLGVAIGVIAASVVISARQEQKEITAPLGDVARQAEAAKATVKKAKKTYTNADLSADPHGVAVAPPPATPGFANNSPGKVVTAQEGVKRSDEKVDQSVVAPESEAQWRARAEAIRVQIARVQEQRQGLLQPNPARDANPAAMTRYTNELTKVQQGLDGLTKQWDRLEASARERKVKTEWLDPRPPQ